jgi:hypothetical protein
LRSFALAAVATNAPTHSPNTTACTQAGRLPRYAASNAQIIRSSSYSPTPHVSPARDGSHHHGLQTSPERGEHRVVERAPSAWTATKTVYQSGPRSGRRRYRVHVIGAEHLDELRRRLAEQTDHGATGDRVTTDRLARMRRRLSELEHISENTIDEAEAMSAEDEVHEIMDSLENVRELRPSDDG